MEDTRPSDEFGYLDVWSEERLAHLKTQANEKYTSVCERIKKAGQVVSAVAEFTKLADDNAKLFYSESKEYVEILKKIEEESFKVKF